MSTMGLTDEIRARRVAVAKDVIERIDLGKLMITTGYYLDAEELEVIPDSEDLQGCVDTIELHCPVCARGALLLSKARLFNAVPMSSIIVTNDEDSEAKWVHVARSDTVDLLADTFDVQTLALIEVAFEQDTNWAKTREGFKRADPRIERALRFGCLHANPETRVYEVMANLIENNGEFIPPTEA